MLSIKKRIFYLCDLWVNSDSENSDTNAEIWRLKRKLDRLLQKCTSSKTIVVSARMKMDCDKDFANKSKTATHRAKHCSESTILIYLPWIFIRSCFF